MFFKAKLRWLVPAACALAVMGGAWGCKTDPKGSSIKSDDGVAVSGAAQGGDGHFFLYKSGGLKPGDQVFVCIADCPAGVDPAQLNYIQARTQCKFNRRGISEADLDALAMDGDQFAEVAELVTYANVTLLGDADRARMANEVLGSLDARPQEKVVAQACRVMANKPCGDAPTTALEGQSAGYCERLASNDAGGTGNGGATPPAPAPSDGGAPGADDQPQAP